jgi:glycosyltransferase involved in cell wall biosynthesis
MKVALVSTCAVSTPPVAYGGTELIVAELAKGLHRLGHEVTTFATGDSRPEGALRSHFAEPVWPPNDLAEMRHAAAAMDEIARGDFDLVHVHHAAALPFGRFMRKPMVLTVHHCREEGLVAHYRDHPNVSLVAISNRQAKLCPELSFARTIYHGLDAELYPAGPGGDYVAFLGRFAEEKGAHLALDAARAAGVPLHLGGKPHHCSLDYFAREVQPRLRDLGAGAVWHGELSHEPKLELLRGARALLVPIEWEEPFGLVMIEAMLTGTPVIAFARGSAPEVVEEGVTGFLVRDVREMSERIRALDRIDRVRCRARARERWTTERMARDYLSLYESVRTMSHGGAHIISFADAEVRVSRRASFVPPEPSGRVAG